MPNIFIWNLSFVLNVLLTTLDQNIIICLWGKSKQKLTCSYKPLLCFIQQKIHTFEKDNNTGEEISGQHLALLTAEDNIWCLYCALRPVLQNCSTTLSCSWAPTICNNSLVSSTDLLPPAFVNLNRTFTLLKIYKKFHQFIIH